MAIKNKINLLQAELFPAPPLLTLPKVAAIWAVLLFLMIIWSVATQINFKSSAQTYDKLLSQKQEKQQQTQKLESQLKNRQVSPELRKSLSILQLVIQHKDSLLNELTDSNDTFAGGFVMAMNDLSLMHHKDIRLQQIQINAQDMSFKGLARTPQAVPAWLDGFKNSRLLSGKSFSNFKLKKNEQNITEFVVSSVAKKGSR